MSRSTNPTAYAKLAANTFLFSGIPEGDIYSLLLQEGVRVEHFDKDQIIFDRHDTERALGIILYGTCVVTKESENGKMPMSVLKQTDLFGAAALFHEEEAYVARVMASESTWVLLISEDALRGMMQKDFRVTENYLRYLTARIRFLSARLDGFLPQSVEERVFNHIKSRAEDGLYESEWSVSALAETLCIGRTTLYRAMDKLVSEGKIERHGRAFRLPKGENE
jgi:CRP/FNR family transcriptional regulator, dissimilatory nitrate respiration regulator